MIIPSQNNFVIDATAKPIFLRLFYHDFIPISLHCTFIEEPNMVLVLNLISRRDDPAGWL